jgi:hypothetical protein
MFFSLPDSGGRAEEGFGCDRVVAHSGVSEKAQTSRTIDFAILKLDHPSDSSRWLEVSREGLPDSLAVTILSAKVESDTGDDGEPPVASLSARPCVVALDTFHLPESSHPFSPVGVLTECQVKKGESGSPLIDASGNVRALLQAGSNVASLPEELARWSEIRQWAVIPIALATNLACVRPLSGYDPLPIECWPRPDDPSRELRRMEQASTDLLNELQRLMDADPDTSVLARLFGLKPELRHRNGRLGRKLGTPNAGNAEWFEGWGLAIPRCVHGSGRLTGENSGSPIVVEVRQLFWPAFTDVQRGRFVYRVMGSPRTVRTSVTVMASATNDPDKRKVVMRLDPSESANDSFFDEDLEMCNRAKDSYVPTDHRTRTDGASGK